jgi:hypothetical protein
MVFWRNLSMKIKNTILFLSVILIGTFPFLSKADAGLETLNEAFNVVTYTPVSQKELILLGNKVQEFVSNPKNVAQLKTQSGLDLVRKQTKLVNYVAIQKVFENCSLDSKRQLNVRILDAAGEAKDIQVSCGQMPPTFSGINKFIKDSQKISNVIEKDNLQTKIYHQAIKNSALAYLDLKFRYSTGKVNPLVVMDLCLKKIRGSKGNYCDKETQELLLKTANEYLNSIKTTKRFTAQEASAQINLRVDEMNKGLNQISVNANRGWFSKWVWDRSSPDFNDEAQNDVKEKYVSKYLAAASDGPGLLMLTDHMKEKIGGLKTEEDLKKKDAGNGNKKFIFSPHNKVTSSDVIKAVNEAQELITSQSLDLVSMDWDRRVDNDEKGKPKNILSAFSTDIIKKRTTDIKHLIQVNPQAVGQILINNPQMASLVCEAINQISKDDESDAKWRKAHIWGGAIVGGALLVTGVGSAAGAWILAGTATAATLATVGTVTTIAGLAVGLTETGIQTAHAMTARRAQTEFESAFLTGNGDSKSIQEARHAMSDFNEAKMNAMLSLGFSSLDVASLAVVLKAGRMSTQLGDKAKSLASNTKALEETTSLLKRLMSNPKYISMIQKAKLDVGGQKVMQFFGYLGQISEAARLKILEKMSTWPSERFRKVIEDAIATANGCVK